MNKTIYIKEEDVPVFDKARELGRGKVNAVIMDALRKFVQEQEEKRCPTCGHIGDGADEQPEAYKGPAERWVAPSATIKP